MKLKEILEILEAETIHLCRDDVLEQEYHFISATDLMSDALAMVCSNSEETIMLTGLANAQTLRTAEVLDIECVILVRNKTILHSDIELNNGQECNLFTTHYSMYEACGLMYVAGMRTATK
jgi:hypothetical protein